MRDSKTIPKELIECAADLLKVFDEVEEQVNILLAELFSDAPDSVLIKYDPILKRAGQISARYFHFTSRPDEE